MAKIYYTEVDDFIRKEERYELLRNAKNIYGVEWQEITPDKNHTWLTEGLDNDFDKLMPMGTKEAKAAYRGSGGEGLGAGNVIFNKYSLGVSTARDAWAYNYNKNELENNIKKTINAYNSTVFNYQNLKDKIDIDKFVNHEDNYISWSRDLKKDLKRIKVAEYDEKKIKLSFYRPFNKQYLFYDRILNEETRMFENIFPTNESEQENLLISITAIASSKPFHCMVANTIVDMHFMGDTQCFPYYTYNEDSTGRTENISDWALTEYRNHYKDASISKWDIFYYIYGVLHNPEYREKYSANLRRSLPRIPFYSDFWKYSNAGKQLAILHVNYEEQPVYFLQKIEKENEKLNWRVEKMRLSKDKKSIIYNDFLTLTGIPAEVFEYKLGNRSALDWLIDQYRIKIDKRSGITNDPNRADKPDYIVKLIGKIITVSIETVRIVKEMEK